MRCRAAIIFIDYFVHSDDSFQVVCQLSNSTIESSLLILFTVTTSFYDLRIINYSLFIFVCLNFIKGDTKKAFNFVISNITIFTTI